MLVKAPLQAAMDFAGEFAVLRRLTNELNNIRSTFDRYHATAGALEECSRLIGSLRIERYWGDYSL